MKKEVGKLLDAIFIKKIKFQTWVTNPILLKKNKVENAWI